MLREHLKMNGMDPKVDSHMHKMPDEQTSSDRPENENRAKLKTVGGQLAGTAANDPGKQQQTETHGISKDGLMKGGMPLRVVMKFLVPLAILAAAMGGYIALKASKPEPRKPKIVEKAWPVDARAASVETVTPTLKLFGKTVANRSVELRALVAGKITAVGAGLKAGAVVKKGDMLVEIDKFDYQGALTEAKANLQEAEARKVELEAAIEQEKRNLDYAKEQLALAERDFERVEALSKKGTVTKKLADDRKVIVSQRAQSVATSSTNIKLQQARLTQQIAVIERLKWKQTQAERRLEETTLNAPFDAYVSAVNAELGKTVSANDQIARLIDTDAIDVRFTLTDAQYGRIIANQVETGDSLIGREVTLEWKVGETPITYSAAVTRIGAEIASETGGVEIYARVNEPQKPTPLRTGAFVEVSLKDRRYESVYKLPQTALYQGDTIYIIKNSRLEPVKVTIVNTTGSDMLVTGPIPEGAKVLTTKLTLAGKGVKVNVRGSTENNEKPSGKDKTANSTVRDVKKAAKGL
jgi:RND family efflux transporter MFP subunit